MRVGFDGGIQLELHGSKVTSNGGLLAYRDLDYALGYLIQYQRYLSINVPFAISNMLCPLSCVNLYTVVLRVMKMSFWLFCHIKILSL